MAQIDTGLGWSADSEYLVSLNPALASLVQLSLASFPDAQPLPKVTSKDTVTTEGMLLGTGYQIEIYGGASDDGFLCFLMGNNAIYGFAGTNNSTYVWIATKNTVSGSVNVVADVTLTRYHESYYYYSTTLSGANMNGEQYIPKYDSVTFPYNDIVYSTMTYQKLNPGYAVACVAEWYTPAGNTLISPILISSDPLATVITTDGTTPAANMTTFDFLYDGIRFYMAIIADNSTPLTAIVTYADLRQFAAALPQKVFTLIASESFANIQVTNSPDPYSNEGGSSEEEGGDGEDEDDDPVEEETMPIPAVVGLGFSTIYVPTQTDLYNLAAYLWGGNLNLDNFLKLFANPMDSILGLSAVPLVLSGTYEPIYLGGQLLQGITMPRYTGRTAVKVDMGTVTISERWGSYLDYDPYTEMSIYLPFVGIKNIKADDVMKKTVRLMYDIDILSGACIAYIRPEGGSPLYEWSGQCAMQIPITGANWDNIFNSAIHTAATLGGALFAPASAPVLGNAVASAASQAIAAKPRIERSGAMNGVTGFLGQLRPYIIRTIPEAYIPNDQNKFIGYPSYVSVNLGQLTGYNEIASIHLENIPATGDELSELESILKGGVIF